MRRLLAMFSPPAIRSVQFNIMAEMIPRFRLDASQELVIQAFTANTYFVYDETPSGSINDSNVTFVLAHTPNPANSLELYLNGQTLVAGGADFTLSGLTITMVNAPFTGDILTANYTVSPV